MLLFVFLTFIAQLLKDNPPVEPSFGNTFNSTPGVSLGMVKSSCANCGKDYWTWAAWIRKGQINCSKKCNIEYRKGIVPLAASAGLAVYRENGGICNHVKRGKVLKCGTCKREFYTYPGNVNKRKFCSRRCQLKHYETNHPTTGKTGALSGGWRGGVTKVNESIRRSKKYKKWRAGVLERDGHKCVQCGSGLDLNADHIKPFALYPELRFELTNGRTLCVVCHRKTPTYGNKKMYNKQKNA